jgi:cytochrome c
MAAGEKSGLGPNLWGVGGRIAGTLPEARYSSAMKASKIKWTRAALTAFLIDPRKSVAGTTMGFPGVRDTAKAAEIADYLMSLR